VTNEFQAFAALVLNSITESIVRLKVLKFSAAAYRVDCHLVVDTDTEEDVECFG